MQIVKIVEPGDLTRKWLDQRKMARRVNLSDIPRDNGWCKWCNFNETTSNRSHYCSEQCKTSAYIWCSPQQNPSHFIIQQDYKCNLCSTDFREEHEDGVMRLRSDVWIEIDHIEPIWNGGEGLGVHNHQALCSQCHKDKTSREAKDRANKRLQ